MFSLRTTEFRSPGKQSFLITVAALSLSSPGFAQTSAADHSAHHAPAARRGLRARHRRRGRAALTVPSGAQVRGQHAGGDVGLDWRGLTLALLSPDRPGCAGLWRAVRGAGRSVRPRRCRQEAADLRELDGYHPGIGLGAGGPCDAAVSASGSVGRTWLHRATDLRHQALPGEALHLQRAVTHLGIRPPLACSIVGGSAAFLLGVPQDWPLLCIGLAIVVLVIRGRWRSGAHAAAKKQSSQRSPSGRPDPGQTDPRCVPRV